MASPIEIDDAIVLLLGTQAAGDRSGEIEGITRLEKLIFLLERETSSKEWLTEDADFEPYKFGPFSQKVYQAVDTLAAAQIVVDSASFASDDIDTWEERERIGGTPKGRDPYTTRNFKLTERGWKYYRALSSELLPPQIKELQRFKGRFANLPLRQLIRYVYTRYEAFTTKSIIRDDILGSN
jgi:hypothetical protein